MKAKVMLTHTVELYVEGKDEESIRNWLMLTTPSEAKQLAENNGSYVNQSYDEEILFTVRDDSEVDYVIED